MMYERPPTTPFKDPPRTTTFPFQRYTLVFQQHQDESIYDAWTRFKILIQRVPHHGLDLLSLTQFFYDHVDDYTRMDLDFAADRNLRELSGEEAWEAIENFSQGQKELGITWDKVENSNSQSTPQVLPSFKESPMTHPEEVKETIGIPMKVETLHEPQLKDLGLNTCNHDIPLSSREVHSFDELKPQLQPLPNCPPLDVNLGEKRGTDQPIKPHSSDSFRMKVVDKSTINTPPSPHMASFNHKDIYCYYHPCVDDPKKHYGFKQSLLGQGGSLGVDLSNWEVLENNFLRGLSLPVKPNELEKGRKAHLLEDKQIPSVGVFDKVTWMAFGGNTRDLAHLEKKRTGLRLYTKSFEEIVHTERGDGVTSYKR
ncbi:hypothetical protein Tco_0367069 [Tanacetum coccineum]